MPTLKERVKRKMKEMEMEASDAEEKPQKAVKKDEAKHYYDKEDLISFHELFLSKPLVKACAELDYEHPTVI